MQGWLTDFNMYFMGQNGVVVRPDGTLSNPALLDTYRRARRIWGRGEQAGYMTASMRQVARTPYSYYTRGLQNDAYT